MNATDRFESAAAYVSPESAVRLVEAFKRCGLTLPFAPVDLFARLRMTGDDVYTTEEDIDSLYGLSQLAAKWERGYPREFLAFGFDGYGANSRCMQCAVAGPALAMAGETRFGNFYEDGEAEKAAASAMLADLAKLYTITRGCRQLPWRPGERLMVIYSTRGAGLWRRFAPDGGIIDDGVSSGLLSDALDLVSYKP